MLKEGDLYWWYLDGFDKPPVLMRYKPPECMLCDQGIPKVEERSIEIKPGLCLITRKPVSAN